MHDIISLDTRALNLYEEGNEELLLKSFEKEIYLLDVFIANASFIQNHNLYETLVMNEKLTLLREEHLFYEYMIGVYTNKKEKLGMIPEKDSVLLARLMDAGKSLVARVKSVSYIHNFYQVKIRIFLEDF